MESHLSPSEAVLSFEPPLCHAVPCIVVAQLDSPRHLQTRSLIHLTKVDETREELFAMT